MLIGEVHVPLAKVNGLTPFGRWEPSSLVPKEYWILSKCQIPLIVKVELISGYLKCIFEFGELEFPLELTVRWPAMNVRQHHSLG